MVIQDTLQIRFLTSTPLDVIHGSGTFVGISVLAEALRQLGHEVTIESSNRRLPVYTLERLLFNRGLKRDPSFDVTVGFDLDGYSIAGPAHVASLKGVIADEARFERGLTRATMQLQARWERQHVLRAARVLVTSTYSGEQACRFYGLEKRPHLVPELIDIARWEEALAAHPAESPRFTLLSIGRFYPRKRIDVLLRAAALLRESIPQFELRIVGNGPCNQAWRSLARDLRLDGTVTWLGDVSRSQLAAEYNCCHAFCMPSVQEGFGIVLLEAMIAGKPIVASRAGAIPEVAPFARFSPPDDPEHLAQQLFAEYRSPTDTRPGREWVQRFEAKHVAALFVEAVTL